LNLIIRESSKHCIVLLHKITDLTDIIEMFNKNSTKLYLGDKHNFYSLNQTLQLLELSSCELSTIRKENELTFYNFHNTTYYYKEEINNLLKIKQNISENYVPSVLVSETLGDHYFKYFKNRKKPIG